MNFVNPKEIATVMNPPTCPSTLEELDMVVAQGLPKSALRAVVKRIHTHLDDQNRLIFKVVPQSTYKRRKEKLSAEASGRTERLARVYATTLYIWQDEGDAQGFLTQPHPLLNGRKPIEVAMTELWAKRVTQLLWQLAYDVAC